MAQSVKRPTLNFSLGHDVTVHEFEPCIRLCAERVEPAWDSLSLPSLCPYSACSLSQTNKLEKNNKRQLRKLPSYRPIQILEYQSRNKLLWCEKHTHGSQIKACMDIFIGPLVFLELLWERRETKSWS